MAGVNSRQSLTCSTASARTGRGRPAPGTRPRRPPPRLRRLRLQRGERVQRREQRGADRTPRACRPPAPRRSPARPARGTAPPPPPASPAGDPRARAPAFPSDPPPPWPPRRRRRARLDVRRQKRGRAHRARLAQAVHRRGERRRADAKQDARLFLPAPRFLLLAFSRLFRNARVLLSVIRVRDEELEQLPLRLARQTRPQPDSLLQRPQPPLVPRRRGSEASPSPSPFRGPPSASGARAVHISSRACPTSSPVRPPGLAHGVFLVAGVACAGRAARRRRRAASAACPRLGVLQHVRQAVVRGGVQVVVLLRGCSASTG